MARTFDVIVIGGGHAGCEAASASARSGADTLLLTHRIETVGEMSCNPAIGGVGKAHLVREIDALDGLIGRAADLAGIHFKLLNRSKGPAVQGPRVQTDRSRYRQAICSLLHETPRLTLQAGSVASLLFEDRRVVGIRCEDGRDIRARAVVIRREPSFEGCSTAVSRRCRAGGMATRLQPLWQRSSSNSDYG